MGEGRRAARSIWVRRCDVSLSDPPQARLSPKQMLPDGLEVRSPSLHLLRNGIHVPETAFERVGIEDRGGACFVIGDVDHLFRLMDRIGGRLADSHPLIGGELARDCHRVLRPRSTWISQVRAEFSFASAM